MSLKVTLFCASALAFVVGAGAALGSERPPDGLVVFINSGSSSVTVSVDGATVCTIEPVATCSTVLSGTDSDFEHAIHGDIGSSTWDDKLQISECHWNWNGTKTYTFTDQNVPFECKKDEE